MLGNNLNPEKTIENFYTGLQDYQTFLKDLLAKISANFDNQLSQIQPNQSIPDMIRLFNEGATQFLSKIEEVNNLPTLPNTDLVEDLRSRLGDIEIHQANQEILEQKEELESLLQEAKTIQNKVISEILTSYQVQIYPQHLTENRLQELERQLEFSISDTPKSHLKIKGVNTPFNAWYEAHNEFLYQESQKNQNSENIYQSSIQTAETAEIAIEKKIAFSNWQRFLDKTALLDLVKLTFQHQKLIELLSSDLNNLPEPQKHTYNTEEISRLTNEVSAQIATILEQTNNIISQ